MAGRDSRAKEVFRSHHKSLEKAITAPGRLAETLLTKKLIGPAVNKKVNNARASTIIKAVRVLKEVRATLEASSHAGIKLRTFCDVLNDSGEPALEAIATKMKSSLGESRTPIALQSQPVTQDNENQEQVPSDGANGASTGYREQAGSSTSSLRHRGNRSKDSSVGHGEQAGSSTNSLRHPGKRSNGSRKKSKEKSKKKPKKSLHSGDNRDNVVSVMDDMDDAAPLSQNFGKRSSTMKKEKQD